MRKAVLLLAVPALLLAGCEMKIGGDKKDKDASLKVGEDGNVSIAANDGDEGVSVKVPGFEAHVNVPGIELGGDDMDIDGMKLFPGTKLAAINVTDTKGANNGKVDMRFTSPAAPDKVAAYYEAAARDNDFTNVKVASAGGKSTLTADKSDGDKLTITMEPATAGTAGLIQIRDKGE